MFLSKELKLRKLTESFRIEEVPLFYEKIKSEVPQDIVIYFIYTYTFSMHDATCIIYVEDSHDYDKLLKLDYVVTYTYDKLQYDEDKYSILKRASEYARSLGLKTCADTLIEMTTIKGIDTIITVIPAIIHNNDLYSDMELCQMGENTAVPSIDFKLHTVR